MICSSSLQALQVAPHFSLLLFFHQLGITLRSVTEPIDDSPTGKLIEGILAATAQFDNDVKAERTRAGMLAAVSAGRWTHQAPIGYLPGRRPGPSLVVDEERAAFIRAAFGQRQHGKDEREILRRLTATGLTNHRGRPLSPQTFSAILRNPVYAGRIELPKWGYSGVGDWQPLVSQDVFRPRFPAAIVR